MATLVVAGGCASCDPADLPNQGRADTPETFVEIYRHVFQEECWETAYDLSSPRTREEHSYAEFWVAVPSFIVPLPGAEGTVEAEVPLRCIVRDSTYVEDYRDVPEDGQATVVGAWRGYQVNLILVSENVPTDANDPGSPLVPEWRLGMLEMTELRPPWPILIRVENREPEPIEGCDDD